MIKAYRDPRTNSKRTQGNGDDGNAFPNRALQSSKLVVMYWAPLHTAEFKCTDSSE